MVELLILGLLRKNSPLHGYEIKRQLDQLAIGNSSKVSFGSLYPTLQKLQKNGFVMKYEDPKGDMKRFSFTITKEGTKRFFELMSSNEVNLSYKLLFFDEIESALRKEILAQHREELQLELEERLKQKSDLAKILDKYQLAVLDRSVERIQSDIDWIIKLEQEE